MEGEFKLTIALGNEAMLNIRDVCWVLKKMGTNGIDYNGIIRDDNGNTVGRYSTTITVRDSDGDDLEFSIFGDRPIGEAFNDPRVACCGRDIADCDCEANNFKDY